MPKILLVLLILAAWGGYLALNVSIARFEFKGRTPSRREIFASVFFGAPILCFQVLYAIWLLGMSFRRGLSLGTLRAEIHPDTEKEAARRKAAKVIPIERAKKKQRGVSR